MSGSITVGVRKNNWEDGEELYFGSDQDYWFEYDNSQFEFWSADSDGSGTNGKLFSIDDGTDIVDFENDISFPNLTGTPTFASHDHSEGGLTTVPNAGLSNSSVTVAGNSVALGASTAVSVADLSDVASATEAAGQLLVWNNTATEYQNAALTGGNAIDVTNADASVTLAVTAGAIDTNELATPFTDLSTLFGSPVSVGAADLRLDTGNAIEDGGGTIRYELQSGNTRIYDSNGSLAINLNSGARYQFLARSSEPWQLRDAQGTFTALDYSTSATAPGTLTLDANTFIKAGARFVRGSTSSQPIGTDADTQILGTNFDESSLLMAAWVGASGPTKPQLQLYKSRGGAIGDDVAVQDGDQLGGINFYGDDGAGGAGAQAVRVRGEVDGAVAAGQVPGRLIVQTATSAGTVTEVLRLNSSQQILAAQDGSASAPAFSFTGDTDTGIHRPSNDGFRLTAGGTDSLQIRSDNAIGLLGNDITRVGGTNDASSGAIRLGENAEIRTRDSGFAQDIGLIRGNSSSNTIQLGFANSYNIDLTLAGSVRITNGSGTALPGTTADGQIRLFDDTDATDPSGRIQFQANSTTFTVNADAGITFRDEVAFGEAMEQNPLGPDETRCYHTGERFHEGDPVLLTVDETRYDSAVPEMHTVPVSLDRALAESERIRELEERIEQLESAA